MRQRQQGGAGFGQGKAARRTVEKLQAVLSSSPFSCRLTAGWVRCSKVAARETVPSRATVMKQRKAWSTRQVVHLKNLYGSAHESH